MKAEDWKTYNELAVQMALAEENYLNDYLSKILDYI